MSPTEDIIPITFMGGTGGNFLCHFIVSAKRNSKDVIELSKHGNAHENCLKEAPGPPFGHNQPDTKKIIFILTQPLHSVAEKPYYTSAHITDINLINTYFKKSIRITYEQTDIEEIASVYYGKWYIDGNNVKSFSNTKRSHKIHIGMFQPTFTKIENMSNVLFISWKELFKGDIEELIRKISIFTDINLDNFSRESIVHWRTKTQYCIDTFSETK